MPRRGYRVAEKPQPPLGAKLEEIRNRKRFSQRSLADTADISNTYLRSIEEGYDPRTTKEVRPSPDVLRQLAGALASTDRNPEEEEEIIYAELMDAAGWLPKLRTANLSALESEKAERLAEMQSKYLSLSRALEDCERIIREASA